DYDVRFIYVRPRNDYLALKPVRDVVEKPILDDIDLNGWDVRKALGLMLKHNAVVSEWIESPIRYRDHDPMVGRLAELGDQFFDPHGFAKHYSNLGKRQTSRWLSGSETPTIKKYFYALRPALAVRCLRLDPSHRPPMRLQDLIEGCQLSAEIVEQIEELVALKSETREAGATRELPDLTALVVNELDRADEVPVKPTNGAFEDAANALFVDLLASG
ncbi:MAG: nucleotidyltransferase domain-containing protein, partial [Pseudomonadota bacterium]